MTPSIQPPIITHNTDLNRFETTIHVDQTAYTGYISYQIKDTNTLVYDHTIVPKQLGGQGVGSALVKHVLEYAQNQGKKVVPQCWFVAKYINKHEQYQHLVA